MPNLAFMIGGNIPYATQIWTIGVEEQFYLVWPWLFKKIKNKLNIYLTVILGYIALYYLFDYLSDVHKYLSYLKIIWSGFPISCLAIGGLFAQLVFVDTAIAKKIKAVLFSFWFQLIMLVLLVFLIIIKFQFPFCDGECYSFLLGYHVCNLAANPKTIFSLENKVLAYLGKISYGIYMFHPVVIIFGIRIGMLLQFRSIWLLYAVTILLSIGIAAISYHFYEAYFIKRKIRYSKIVTGDNVGGS